ncbi:sensor histidine kinase, partial [Nocardia gipuzkoensis]
GLPQRDALGGLPQRDALGGRESTAGLPPREAGSTGLPQRQPGSNGVPQRESAAGGLPQREPGVTGLPPRQPAPNLPQRESASGGLPQRETGNGLPQRDTGAHHLPQRESANGFSQREPGIANGLPQRPPAPSSPPQRESGLTGLPQRQPGAQAPQRQPVPPGIALPQRGGQHAASEDQQATPPGRDPGKHSFRSNPAKTASFFQTRLQPAEESGASMGGTPIFAEMMSAWLSDPSTDRSQVAASFESPGDEGWQAARRASEAQTETKTAAGLPQRNPGGRLVPGGVTGAVDRAPRRDPETIRSSLSRHQQGVRDGRAMRAMNLTGDKGDR